MTARKSERILDICALIGARGLCTRLRLVKLEDLAVIGLQQLFFLILAFRLFRLWVGVPFLLALLRLGFGAGSVGLAAGGSLSFCARVHGA